MKIYRVVSVVLSLTVLASVLLSACGQTEKPTVPPEGYSYDPGDAEPSSSGDASESEGVSNSVPANEGFAVDASWQSNFLAEYLYFDEQLGTERVRVKEVKTASAFEAKYPVSGNFFYYKADGTDLLVYTAVPDEDLYTKSVEKGKSVSDISSTFMKLSAVDPAFSALANVLYIEDDTVAGRPCKKYIQRAYTDGEATETVYIWIDSEFGFAAKCEAYDADEDLTTYWELLLFETGSVTASAIDVDVDDYEFEEG